MDERLSVQHWLDAGLERLAAHGPKALQITAIAQQLGVTKGSFYWHFRDLGEYRDALLKAWERSHTQQIVDEVERAGGAASSKLRRLMALTAAGDASLSRAMRNWSGHDAVVGKTMARVDRKRLAYVGGLLGELGWDAADAATLARWTYSALIGHFTLQGPALTPHQMDLIFGTLMVRR